MSRPLGPGPTRRGEALAGKDRLIIGLLACFTLFNVTLDLWLVLHARDLPSRADHDLAGRLWAVYAEADRFWVVAPWSLAQEGLNVFVTTPVNLWLIAAILRRAPYRHALQLALGAYLTYSCILYLLAGHLSGYEGMRARTPYALALFYGATLPWLLGHGYLAGDSIVAIARRFAAGGAPSGRPGWR